MNYFKSKAIVFVALFICFYSIFLLINFKNNENQTNKFSFKKKLYDTIYGINSDKFLSKVRVRDFMYYQCKNIKRIGGNPGYLKNAPDKLWRIDGAWYICMDANANPKKSNCNVLSFGINHDFTFDKEMRYSFGCSVYSFDPIVESEKFSKIRQSNPSLKNSIVLNVDNNWRFYRVGLIGKMTKKKTVSNLLMQDLIDLDNILDLTNLKGQVIDVFKMDIEGPEKGVFENLDMEYACKFIKNLIFETHPYDNLIRFDDLVKLEKCFRLFWRSTRFFAGDTRGPTGHLTEFQNPNGWKLDIKKYKNEINLAETMFTSGELYFVNINFL